MPRGLACLAMMAVMGGGAASAGTFTHVATLDALISGGLAADRAGNLYAETEYADQLVQLPAAGGYAAARVLYVFPPSGALGTLPLGGVTLDRGMILGVAAAGGAHRGGTIVNFGTAGHRAPTVLHSFDQGNTKDGYNPAAGLTPGPGHVLYGTTSYTGGYAGEGVVFAVGGDAGGYGYKVIHRFSSDTGDGAYPTSGRLAVGAGGAIFGLTLTGGDRGNAGNEEEPGGGAMFMLQQRGGAWQAQLVASFDRAEGQLAPSGGSNVVVDAAGTLFTCLGGGRYGFGGVIAVAPPQRPGLAWRETTVFQFGAHFYDPHVHEACAITLDPGRGGIVGVTDEGGTFGAGTVFTLTPPAGREGGWTSQVVHDFTGGARDGGAPLHAPLYVEGGFFGTAGRVVWRYVP